MRIRLTPRKRLKDKVRQSGVFQVDKVLGLLDVLLHHGYSRKAKW